MNIDICYNFDINRWKYVIISMVSVVENNKNKNICFHLMVDESFDAEIIEHIEQKITSKLVEVKFYKIHKINNKTLGPVTTAGYYRLLTPNLFPNLDRVIYIDDDIICNGDITALWNTKLTPNEWIGAVKDPVIRSVYTTYKNRKYYIHFIKKYNLEDCYINSGMLLLNLKALRKNNVQKKWEKLIYNPLPFRIFNDQDIINPTCVNHVKFLDDKWDWFTNFENENIKSMAFLHFSGHIKPWNNSHVLYFDYWKKYADIAGHITERFYIFGNSFTEQFIAQTDKQSNYYFINTKNDKYKKYFKKNFLSDKHNILIITHQAWNTGWNRIMKRLKERTNAYYYFLYNFAERSSKIKLLQKIFQKRIITYDKTDQRKYGMPFIPFPVMDMSKYTFSASANCVDWTFLAGGYITDTHRFKNCYWLLKKLGKLPHRFVIASNGITKSTPDNVKYVVKNINFKTKGTIVKDYKDSVIDTRCVCFIKQNAHEYFSVAIPWAIRNNKKILTDLNLIKIFPGYDPRWIKVIPDFSKIDDKIKQWIKDDKIVPNYTHKEWFDLKQFILNFKKLIA